MYDRAYGLQEAGHSHRKNRFFIDGTPISKAQSRRWARSISWRDGALTTCMKKFEDASTPVEKMLMTRCSSVSNSAARVQSPWNMILP